MFENMPKNNDGDLILVVYTDGGSLSIPQDTFLNMFGSDQYDQIVNSETYKNDPAWAGMIDQLHAEGKL